MAAEGLFCMFRCWGCSYLSEVTNWYSIALYLHDKSGFGGSVNTLCCEQSTYHTKPEGFSKVTARRRC